MRKLLPILLTLVVVLGSIGTGFAYTASDGAYVCKNIGASSLDKDSAYGGHLYDMDASSVSKYSLQRTKPEVLRVSNNGYQITWMKIRYKRDHEDGLYRYGSHDQIDVYSQKGEIVLVSYEKMHMARENHSMQSLVFGTAIRKQLF